ncbi:MAG: hypothetical protein ACRDTT_18260, partial [Pseudonocardiaceae bacterium]
MIRCDGSPEAVAELDVALRAVLDGGAALVPLGPGVPPPARDPGAGQDVMATSGSTAQPPQPPPHQT